MSGIEPYEVYAIKYSQCTMRVSETILDGPRDDRVIDFDFYVWAVIGPGGSFVIDTGFDKDVGRKRDLPVVQDTGTGLESVGLPPGDVRDVIITHMHYDHSGNGDLFPHATFHIQDLEMAYATGRHMCHEVSGGAYEGRYVADMVRRLYRGEVRFHDGVDEVAPGVTVHHVGGHTLGMQVVRVWTRRGWVVLASDATHLYRNIEQWRPFPSVFNVGDVVEGFRTLHKLASSPNHIIPGHDPLVLKRYPPPRPELAGLVARLDADPVDAA